MTVKPRKMGAKISAKSRGRKIFRYGSASQMVQAFKNPNLHARFGQVRSHDRPVVPSSDNDRIVTLVSHFFTSYLFC
jgi:hypothetical protein